MIAVSVVMDTLLLYRRRCGYDIQNITEDQLSAQPRQPERTPNNAVQVDPIEEDEAEVGVWKVATQRSSELAAKTADASRNAVSKAADMSSKAATKAADVTTAQTARVLEAAQALLSSDFSDTVNRLVAATVAGPVTVYDKAMDANYLDTLLRPGLGGSYHRLFDGGHTLAGAAKAVRQASLDDTVIQEAHGAVLGLLRDASTTRGLPLATWDKTTFDSVAATLNDKFAVPKSWLYEVNTFDVADLLGASVGVVAVVYGWNRADVETFARVAANAGVSSAVAVNPLLMLVAIAALARAYDKARRNGEYGELVDGTAKGMVGSTATLATVAAVSAVGGSSGLMLLSGLTAGVVAHRVTRDVNVEAVARYLTSAVSAAATEASIKTSRSFDEAATELRSQYRRLASVAKPDLCR